MHIGAEFGQGRENEQYLGSSYGLAGGGDHLENKIINMFIFACKNTGKYVNTGKNTENTGNSHEVECGNPFIYCCDTNINHLH